MRETVMILQFGARLGFKVIAIGLRVLVWLLARVVVPAIAAGLGYALTCWQERAERDAAHQADVTAGIAASHRAGEVVDIGAGDMDGSTDPWVVSGTFSPRTEAAA